MALVSALDNVSIGLPVAPSDSTTPVISSISAAADTFVAGETITFTLDANEDLVSSAGGATLTLEVGSTLRTAAYSAISGGNAEFAYTVQAADNDADGVRVTALTIPADALEDAAGNDLDSSGAPFDQGSTLVDALAPTVTSVGVPADATYTAGQNLDFTVNFDEAVTVNTGGGTPQIALTIGSTARQATYVSGSGTTALTFRYTVQSGEGDFDGIAVGALSANGGTLRDAAGNDAGLTLTSIASTAGVLVDASAPAVTSFTRQTPSGATSSANMVTFRATFSEDMNPASVVAGVFALSGSAAGDGSIGTISPVGGDPSAYDVQVTGITSSNGTINLDLSGGPAASDAAGNAMTDFTEPATDETYTIDNTAPSGFTVSFDQASLTGANAASASFTFGSAEIGAAYSYVVTSSGGGGSGTGTGTLATASDTVSGVNLSGLSDGTLTLSVTLTDPVGNIGTAATDTVTKDTSAPRLDTISRQNPADATTRADSPVFRVVFTEAMTVGTVNPADFAISGAGAGGASLAVTQVNATTFDVTVSGVASNDGALDLALAGSPTLTDGGGNPLTNPAALGAVEGYILDNTAPTVAFTTAPGPLTGPFTVTAAVSSDAAASFVEGDVSITGGAISPASFTDTGGGGFSFEVAPAGAGTITIAAAAGVVEDAVGNTSAASSITRTVSAPTITLSASTSSPGEGAGTVTLTATQSAAFPSATTVTLSYSGTATGGGTDYTGATTLTILAGATTGTADITLVDDAINEPAETIIVDIASVGGAAGAVEDGTQQQTITLTDDDAAPGLSIADVSLAEGASGTSTATFTVSLGAASGNTVTVDYATADDSATAGDDYTAASGTLTFAPGVAEQTFDVIISGDGVVELDEAFTVTLSAPSNATISDSEATGAITNDDAATLSIADVTQAEGDAGTSTFDFTVTLSAPSDADIELTASTADGTAEAGADYTALSAAPVTIAAGDTSATVQVTVTGDTRFEPGETFALTLAGLSVSGRAVSFADDEATGTITNDDAAPNLALSSPTVAEGAGTAVVTATLDAPIGAPVSFTWSTNDGEAEAPDDYAAVASQAVTIPAGATEASLSIVIIDDPHEELGETFTVSIADLTTAVIADPITVVTIEASDVAAPEAVLSAEADVVSGPFVLTIGFTEPVTGLELSDLEASNAALSDLEGAQADYTVTVTPADDGTVTIALPAGAAQDAIGTASLEAEPFAATADLTAPSVTLATAATGLVSGPFQITITFSEAVSGFELADIAVENGAAAGLSTDDDTVFTATITPAADGVVTVGVAAAAAQDGAGNASTPADPLSVETDATPPQVSITVPGAETTGAFTASFTFSEPVEGFELTDIAVINGGAAALSTDDDTVFTAEITPQSPGTVTISLAAGAAADAAGNGSLEASAAIEAVAEAEAVVLVLGSSMSDPGAVSATSTITNPGSDPLSFNAAADVAWIDVAPASGTVPALGELDLVITLNAEVEALAPGDYTGTVTVTVGGGSAPAGAMTTAATAGARLVEIPISLEVQNRFGAVTLVATTPSGASGEAAFTYASDIAAFDALTLSTSNGRASASVAELLHGGYQIAQTLPAGWRVESIACTGDLDGGTTVDADTGTVTVDLDASESLTCIFKNVRDEDAVRLATQRAIRGFMARRADRIVEAAPDLSRRFSERDVTERGAFSADVDGSGRYQMSLAGSLAGARNAAAANMPAIVGVTNYERPFLQGWDVWFAAELSGVTDNRAGERASSDFGVAQLGVDNQLSDSLIVGLLAQYDWMEETAQDIFEDAGAIAGARVEGEGWMAGPYAVWRIGDSLIFDALAMTGRSDNRVDPLGLYEDDFETDRFMLRANLTGEFVSPSGAWRLRPQAGLTHFEETQDGYVDSLGIVIPEQTVALGRFRAGPELAWRHAGTGGGFLEFTTALNAVWDYQAAELFNEAGLLVGADDDLRADARFGLSTLTPWGAMIRLETGFGGIGIGDFEARNGRFEIRIPFGASGAGTASRLGSAVRGQDACSAGHGSQGFDYAAGITQECPTPHSGQSGVPGQ